MSQVTVQYRLSEEFRKERGSITGDVPTEHQIVAFDLAEIDAEDRLAILEEASINADGSANVNIAIRTDYGVRTIALDYLLDNSSKVANECRTIAMLRNAYLREKTESRIKNATNAWKRAIANKDTRHPDDTISEHDLSMVKKFNLDISEYDELVAKWKRQAPIWRAEKDAAEARAIEVKAAAEAGVAKDKTTWISKFGSEHLQRGIAAGHDCSRLYLTERATLEYPNFVLDYEKCADWKSRSCPSVNALDLRDTFLEQHEGVTVTIVWLTSPPRSIREERSYENFEPCEGIVIDDPLYSRYLVTTIK